MFKAVKRLPGTITVLLIVFMGIPFFSMSFLSTPWALYSQHDALRATSIGLSYWVLPLMVALSITRYHFLFVPVYLLQCVFLFVHCILFSEALPTDMALARFLLIGLMGYVGMLFANKDLVYPFITKKSRMWRTAPRFQFNLSIHLMGDKDEHKIPATMKNCSYSGMGVAVDTRHLKSFLKKKKEGDALNARLVCGGKEYLIPVQIIRATDVQGERVLGLMATRANSMKPIVDWVQEEIAFQARIYGATGPLLTHQIQQSALAIWVFFILLSFGLPAFVTL